MLKLLKKYLFILTFLFIFIVLIVLLLKNSYEEIIPLQHHEGSKHHFKLLSEITAKSSSDLFNIKNFSFAIKPDINLCLSNETHPRRVRAIFLVTSHINNVEVRSAMRRAFSKDDLKHFGVRRVFLLGLTLDNKYINQKAIEDEAKRYGDIVQGNFYEAYKNLTYKHVMGLKWVNKYCDSAQYVIKMDDDIVVYVTKLLKLLKRFDDHEEFISGYVLKDSKVKRIKANKWYLSKDEYGPEKFPQFVSGWLYITRPVVTKKLVELANQENYFWIDDVFVTGILAGKLNLTMYDIKDIFTDHPEYFQCCMNDYEMHKLDCDIVVGPNGGRTNLFYEFNKLFSSCNSECNNRSYKINETCTNSGKIKNSRGNAIVSSYKLIR